MQGVGYGQPFFISNSFLFLSLLNVKD